MYFLTLFGIDKMNDGCLNKWFIIYNFIIEFHISTYSSYLRQFMIALTGQNYRLSDNNNKLSNNRNNK
jgi:membrane-anchored glycerophosphoryl diester phosphodiesterase (GDPDase)